VVFGRKGIDDCKRVHGGDQLAVTYLPENPEHYQLGHDVRGAARQVWLLIALLLYPVIAWLCAGTKPDSSAGSV
jgi:hypothetical protein